VIIRGARSQFREIEVVESCATGGLGALLWLGGVVKGGTL